MIVWVVAEVDSGGRDRGMVDVAGHKRVAKHSSMRRTVVGLGISGI